MNNSYGEIIKISTFGESHGLIIGALIDGFFSNLYISEKFIQKNLNLRKPFTSLFSTQRREQDKVKIFTGIFKNKTTGAPVLMLIKNNDKQSSDYNNISLNFRPGHADYTYFLKYKFRDYRGGGRSSARETACRVASGCVFKNLIYNKGVIVRSYIKKIGFLKINFKYWNYTLNRFFSNLLFINEIKDIINNCKNSCNSLSSEIVIIINGLEPSLGDPLYKKINSTISNYLLSINATKSICFGFNFKNKNSFQVKDEIKNSGFTSNNNGGILAGITNGQPLVIKILFKPTSSTSRKIKTINEKLKNITNKTYGRHDPCVGLRAVPVIESMLYTILINKILKKKIYE
ncbi:chorismate synthase [Candidatus Carsonella ruddii PV]|uniref:Chorismate synthase n=1 Tax=Carsonella ruddii (strain PV) TaxID=387662 RepID=AROC_CARRP|nr:chorismate synthase [Candidatus Carsonella ruddii]Q05FR1.1 RecName: Full=Chorismate synthase; AltName: Full=5-enolpyruvylshikimate-3-phosphate phospholyase [Candidatus Carsonella ruddii PV]BAF35110.1 chorismate synthase [Candidatus Carsonella ruddii PV]